MSSKTETAIGVTILILIIALLWSTIRYGIKSQEKQEGCVKALKQEIYKTSPKCALEVPPEIRNVDHCFSMWIKVCDRLEHWKFQDNKWRQQEQ